MSAQQFTKGPLLYEGKAKRMYATQHPALAIMEFKDSLTAFDAVKKAVDALKSDVDGRDA